VNKENINRFREKLRVIQRELGWSQKNDIECCGVTMAQCHALMEIGKKNNVSIVELAGVLGVDTSTLSRTIDNLVRAGLVDRVLNPQDRRYVTIALTEHGRGISRTIEDSFNGYIRRLFSLIAKEKHAQVMESLVLIAEAIEKCNPDFPCCAGPTRNK
jgi:DNA-binding MarR family transcriptional regulator